MKRIEITPQIKSYMQNALGPDADLNSVSVFEAIAFNTLPIRKKHPLYKGAQADVSLLAEMAAAVIQESRPVHIGHDSDGLPIGRVFHGEVVSGPNGAELRALFFIDNQHPEAVAKIEHGTVDQVSVSVLSKQMLNSVSGFDYFGADADIDNIWTGTDPDGNTIGENGVYARMVGLDSFYEMSLVGQGGAQNARIIRRDQSHFGSSFQKLAASGVDPNALVLVATVEADPMDLTALVTQLTDTKVELSNTNTAKASLEATVASKDSEIATLTASNADLAAKLADLGDVPAALAAKDVEIADLAASKETLAADVDAAVASLQEVAKALLTAAGKLTDEVPATVADLSALITDTKAGLATALVAGGRSVSADGGKGNSPMVADFSAFTAPTK